MRPSSSSSVLYEKQRPAARSAGARRGELAAALGLSLVSLLIWFGLMQLDTAAAAVIAPRAPRSPEQKEAARINRAVKVALENCVRRSIDPACMAVLRNKPALCKEEPECLDSTHMILAMKGKSRCAVIQDLGQRTVCQAAQAGDPGRCASLVGYKLAECQAVAGGKLAGCDALSGETRDRCRGVWHFARAVIKDDVAMCDTIPRVHADSDAPNLFHSFCLAVVKDDERHCKMDLRNHCRRQVPLHNLSRDTCPLLEDAVLRQRCRAQFGR